MSHAKTVSPIESKGRWLLDSSGRVITFHGTNMVNKAEPFAPDAIGFGRDDAEFLAENGLNLVRIGVIWSAVEPHPGRYDKRYLDRIERTVRTLQRAGVASMLDFHQDMYGNKYGGEGFPGWAVVGAARDEEAGTYFGFPANYLLSGQLNRAFDSFWENAPVPETGRGVQDHFASAWQVVARRFKDVPGIAGYNLLNEPWEGSALADCVLKQIASTTEGCPSSKDFDRTSLTAFHQRVLSAIRKVDRRTMVWYAPQLTFDFGVKTNHGKLRDKSTGFAFNAYCANAQGIGGLLPFLADTDCSYAAKLTFRNAREHVRSTGEPLFMTEVGASKSPADYRDYLAEADKSMAGWTHWDYYAPWDPEVVMVPDPKKKPGEGNLTGSIFETIVRPFPQVTSGRPLGWEFNPETRRFDFRFETSRVKPLRPRSKARPVRKSFSKGAVTTVAVPRAVYPEGYSVRVKGAKIISRPGSSWLRLASCRAKGRVSVSVLPGESVPPARKCPG